MATTFRNFENPAPTPGAIAELASTGIVPGPEVTAPPSDPTMLRNLYSGMLLCRMVEEKVEQLAQLQKLTQPLNLRRGLEATVIGSLVELRAGDAISSEPSFAARRSAGQPLGLYFAELYGMRAEYMALAPDADQDAIHLLPPAQTIAAQMNLAAGYALAQKKLLRRNVMVVLLREASNALGYWHEAATLAAAERLPMIFVSTSSALPTVMGNSDARQRAAAYGIPGIAVDGGDVVAMWRVAQESIHRARAGAGPTLIDSHVPAPQANSRASGDPLERMQHYLDKRKLWKQAWKGELTQKFAAEIDEAQAFFPQTSKRQ
jgi:TPP-dependent pyruvate/acetoin dehydrogenase alpha subunit